jgi:DNA mismatch repair protein MutH
MERKEALELGKKLIGKDLRKLAEKYGITVFKNGKKNKGWAGHVIERYLGLPLNSAQSPNFGSWELKLVSLKYLKSGQLTIKETMAITMIDPYNVLTTPFERSHLLRKLQKMLIFTRIWEGKEEPRSILYGVYEFDILNNKELYEQIKRDYELVREVIRTKGFDALTGKMGVYIQPRTKGTGHGSKTRAFYARKDLLRKVIFGD